MDEMENLANSQDWWVHSPALVLTPCNTAMSDLSMPCLFLLLLCPHHLSRIQILRCLLIPVTTLYLHFMVHCLICLMALYRSCALVCNRHLFQLKIPAD